MAEVIALLHTLSHQWRVGLGALLVYLFCLGIYRCYLHPLAKYPGPLAAKVSGYYMVFWAFLGQNTFARHEAHQKYGSIVRLGPNELAFSDMVSIKDIYGQSSNSCPKAPLFYRGFTMTGKESVFSAISRIDHGRMRRLLSYGFSLVGVLQFEAEITRHVKHYLSRISSSASPQPVELYNITHSLFLDITSQMGFAKTFDTLSGRPSPAADDIETYFKIAPVFGLFPVARYLPFGIFDVARKAQPRIVEGTQLWIDEFRRHLRSGTTDRGLLRLMMEAKDSETSTNFTDEELVENAVLFVTAGSSTSATTVLYLLYELGKRSFLQRQLETEIRVAFPDPSLFPDYDTATKLVSLQAHESVCGVLAIANWLAIS